MSATPHESRFQHHGQQAETREAWQARQAAEAAARARAEEERRAAEARRVAAEMQARRAEEKHARRAAEEIQARSAAARSERPVRARKRANKRVRMWPVYVALAVFCSALLIFWVRGYGEAPAAVRVATPTRPSAPVQPAPAPAVEIRPSVPAVAASPDGWWCLCYKTAFHADHTACRRSNEACEGLRAMVQERGTGEILHGTASGCRHVRGSYPWDTLGRHEAWRESARREAVQAIGVCAL